MLCLMILGIIIMLVAILAIDIAIVTAITWLTSIIFGVACTWQIVATVWLFKSIAVAILENKNKIFNY